jgi:copper chaperone CopZ
MKSVLFAAVLGLSTVAVAAEKSETIKVSGWKCDKCPGKTEAKVKAVNGVESAHADRAKGELHVKYDDSKATRAEIDKAVTDSGFAVAEK